MPSHHGVVHRILLISDVNGAECAEHKLLDGVLVQGDGLWSMLGPVQICGFGADLRKE